MPDTEVVVVGAGPAGSAAAITLARAGRRVVLVDKATFPRDKCCGDGLTAGALRMLEELGLDPATVGTWQSVDDVVVRSPSGHEAVFPLPRDAGHYAVVAQRRDLDASLVELARTAGATVLEGHACTGARSVEGGIEVRLDGHEPVRARYAIGADGAWSPLRKHLGVAIPGYRGEWHAFRQYFSEVGPRAASELFVWFEPELLPGYAWSFPLPGGRANVGFGILRGERLDGAEMRRMWPELLERPHIREVLGARARADAGHRAWPIPARIDAITLTAGRALFVGDAAAATDVMTGEGIGQALLTGVLAARAIDWSGPLDPARAAARYEREVHRNLVADHRMSALLARALKHRKGARAAVRVAGATAWTRRNFARWLFEDYPRAVLLTPRRWHRRMLTGPGAFRQPTT